MSELELTIIAVLVIVISIWGMMYFLARIIIRFYVMYGKGNLPNSDELREMYKRNNAGVEYRNHSPTVEK